MGELILLSLIVGWALNHALDDPYFSHVSLVSAMSASFCCYVQSPVYHAVKYKTMGFQTGVPTGLHDLQVYKTVHSLSFLMLYRGDPTTQRL